MLESDSIFKLKVKERTVTCYDDGEEGYGDDLCASGTDYSYIEMPEQTLADGTVVKEMHCLLNGEIYKKIQSPCIGSHLWTPRYKFY